MVAVFAFQSMSVPLVPYATDTGIPVNASALALGLIDGSSVPGRLASRFMSLQAGWGRTREVNTHGR